MANYNTNMNLQQQQGTPLMGQITPIQQYPYGNNNLLFNSPYENYMGKTIVTANQFLKCRPVSSKEEARAYQIDLDGSLWVFTDIGNQKIYTKQINNDGTATFRTYVFTEDESPYNTSGGDYVTKEEFNRTIQNLMAAMQPANPQNLVPAPSNNTDNSKTMVTNF